MVLYRQSRVCPGGFSDEFMHGALLFFPFWRACFGSAATATNLGRKERTLQQELVDKHRSEGRPAFSLPSAPWCRLLCSVLAGSCDFFFGV
jgi:hypothetical protein